MQMKTLHTKDTFALVYHKKEYFLFEDPIDVIDYSLAKFSRKEIEDVLSKIKLFDLNNENIIIQTNYELGEFLVSNSESDDKLFTIYKFRIVKKISLPKEIHAIERPSLSLDSDLYKKMFLETRNALLRGDSYQLNLTHVFTCDFKDRDKLIANFISRTRYHSHYSHVLNNASSNETLLSNSPECLFEIKDRKLVTRPIKGTKSSHELEDLKSSKKDRVELNIITDLLRNDLSAIGENFSQVEKERGYFNVPGLVQQYSEVSVELDESVNMYQVLMALFPGGSITGAPKRRVMSLIKQIEQSPRGHYTGSTIFLTKEFSKASINIRTALLINETLRYGAGGGITLLSEEDEELNELYSKVSSYFDAFF